MEAAEDFPDEYFDWVYIDANHQYDFIREDLKIYYKKVKRGGFITGDDYYVWGGSRKCGVKKSGR